MSTFIGQLPRLAQVGTRATFSQAYTAHTFSTQAEQSSSTQKTPEASKWSQALFGKSNEIRLLLGIAGAVAVVWNFTHNMATREEVKEEVRGVREEVRGLEERVDKRFDVIDRKFDAIDRKFEAIDRKFEALDRKIDQKIDGLKDVLLASARHEQNMTSREAIALRERVYDLEEQKRLSEK